MPTFLTPNTIDGKVAFDKKVTVRTVTPGKVIFWEWRTLQNPGHTLPETVIQMSASDVDGGEFLAETTACPGGTGRIMRYTPTHGYWYWRGKPAAGEVNHCLERVVVVDKTNGAKSQLIKVSDPNTRQAYFSWTVPRARMSMVDFPAKGFNFYDETLGTPGAAVTNTFNIGAAQIDCMKDFGCTGWLVSGDNNANRLISDRRLKSNIAPLTDDEISRGAGLSQLVGAYTLKDDSQVPSGTYVGVVAQEVEKLFPQDEYQIVGSMTEGGTLHVDYYAVLLLMAAAREKRLEARA